MKKFSIVAFLTFALLLADTQVNAQRYRRGGYYSHRPAIAYRVRPRVSIGIGGFWGGFYGPRIYGYGPGVGVNIGVVLPPPGTIVKGLPPGTVQRTYGGITYYYRSNTYYRQREDGGYEIVAPPLGATLDRLPVGARMRKIDGQYYYEHNGNFYKMVKDDDGHTQYIIVGKNGELNTEAANELNYGTDDENEGTIDQNYDDADKSPIVRNGNNTDEENDEHVEAPTNTAVWPQVGDRFDRLPKNTRTVTVNGEKQYVSANGIYYKEVIEDGQTVYEVTKTK